MWVSLKRRKAVSNDVDKGVRKPRRLDRLGGKPGLIDVLITWSFGDVTGRGVHRLVSPEPLLICKAESVAHAIYHGPANNDVVIT